MSEIEQQAVEAIARLRTDFPFYAANCLKIRTKNDGLKPLHLNRVQASVHAALEKQLAETGKIRALVLKARQPGVSTYTEGRFFWRVTNREGVRAFILTHMQSATDALFAMFERYYDNQPELLKQPLSVSNAKEMVFAGLDSGVMVSTAGAKGAGRAQTIQYFHGSEVAHWENAATHMAGVLQAVPDAPGTEIILESTANGVGGLFHDMCRAAEAGDGDYILIFQPWFAHDEYQSPAPEGWEAPLAFEAYAEAHGLTHDQTYWAWKKNGELASACGADSRDLCWLFRQEYPATAAEAFQTSGHESYIRSELVIKARKATAPDQYNAPLIFGVDTARGGRDKTRIIDRRGASAGHLLNISLDTDDEMKIAGRLAVEIDQHHPTMVFVDTTGCGGGVVDRLRERNYRNVVKVNFGAGATDDSKFANKRAEMWGRMQRWFADPAGVDVIDSDELQSHVCAPGYSFDSNSRLLIEKKDEIKKRVGFSPDLGDALALTFAETVRPASAARNRPTQTNRSPRSPLQRRR